MIDDYKLFKGEKPHLITLVHVKKVSNEIKQPLLYFLKEQNKKIQLLEN